MLRRHLQARLEHSLRHFPVVMLTGARQVGKSTLARALASTTWPARYRTLDDRTTLDAALLDPDGFIRQTRTPAVIDEVQRAPDLLRAIKLEVDRDRAPGRFLLTGSANVLTLTSVSETLAGRVAVHQLRPFSWSELRSRPPSPLLELLFEADTAADLIAPLEKRPIPSPEEARTFVLSGGYPTPALMSSMEARHTWFESFRQTYIERDLRDLTQIASLPEFGSLMATLTARTGQLLNASALSRQIGLPTTTLRRYINLLRQTFQIELLQPYSGNLAKRLVKTPKSYAADTGMTCHLVAADEWRGLERHHLVGPLVETWVHTELRKLAELHARHTEVTFWRTHAGEEVDFLMERGADASGIEVKWSARLDPRDLKGLRACRESFGPSWRLGVLLHGGTEAVALDEHTAALPLTMAFG